MERKYPNNQEHSSAEELKNRNPETAKTVPPEEFHRMTQWIQQTQSDAERTRVQCELARSDIAEIRSELASQDRKSKGSLWTTALLLIALVLAGTYGYYELQGQESLLAQLPGVQKSVDAVAQRLSSTEERVRYWADNWNGLTERVGKVEKVASTNLRAARNFAVEQAARVRYELKGEMISRTQSINAKLEQLENSQQQDRVQLAALQQQVDYARSEASGQLASAQKENGREFGDIRQVVDRNRNDVNAIARNLDRQRLNFEVVKNRSHELAPGLAFTALKTDVSHQQVDGYLQLVPEGRFLWVHKQGIEQPMLFHYQGDKRAYEVVFTRVAEDSAVGYVLMPRWSDADLPVAVNLSAPQPSYAAVQ